MNTNDIYLQRFTANQTFEEAPLSVIPNGIVTTDSNSHLIVVSAISIGTASFAATASVAISSSVSIQSLSSSFSATALSALNATTSISSSVANLANFALTSSAANSALTSSLTLGTASYSLTASFALNGGTGPVVSASWASSSISSLTSSLTLGTASYAQSSSNSTTASYSLTASFALNGGNGATVSASWASSSISALTSSLTLGTASYAISASIASISNNALAINFVPQASVSASWVSASAHVINADTASYLNLQIVSASFASASISSSVALTSSICLGTASYAQSSSAQGLIGQITAQVQEWTTTTGQIISQYPSGMPLGTLAYATDANDLRIGDGTTIGGKPVGIRHWNSLTSPGIGDGHIGEVATVYTTTFPADQTSINPSIQNGDAIILYTNVFSGSNVNNWLPMIEFNNVYTFATSSVAFGYVEPWVGVPVINVNYGNSGSNADWFNGIGLNGVASFQIGSVPLICINLGNGGNSINGGTGGSAAGGLNNGLSTNGNSILNIIVGNAGSGSGAGSTGGSSGQFNPINIITGNGGNAIAGGTGGTGGNTGNIATNGGNGGNGSGSFAGGNGGNGGLIILTGGPGANSTPSSNGGKGGNGGQINLGGGNASLNVNGGSGGNISAIGVGIYAGGSINTNALSYRNGGSLYSTFDTYIPSTKFVITQSNGPSNTSTETNFFTASSVIGVLALHGGSIITSSFIDNNGKTFNLKSRGYINADGTSTLTLKLYYGNTVIWQSLSSSIPSLANTASWKLDGDFTFVAGANGVGVGVTSSLIGQAEIFLATSPSSSNYYAGTTNTSNYLIPQPVNSSNEIRLTAQWSNGGINNNIKIINGYCNFFN